MATAYRRKYQFKDRRAAEEAYRKESTQHILQLRLARALYADSVQWGQRRGAYRMGIFDMQSCGGVKIVKVFWPNTTQEPALDVIDPWSGELASLERMAVRYAGHSKDDADLLACIVEIRKMLLPHM